MRKGIFITGTDTEVGKTFVTSGLSLVLRERGIDVGVMKPVASGCTAENGRLTSMDAILLKKASRVKDELDIINPYHLIEPLAPSAAARLEGVTVDFGKIKLCYEILQERHELVLVEGVGGLMVPLNESKVVADLVRYLNLPLIIVVGSKLGAINHTLLTVKYARASGIEIAGIILNHFKPDKREVKTSNREEIERFSRIPILGEIPYCKGEKELLKAVKERIDLTQIHRLTLEVGRP